MLIATNCTKLEERTVKLFRFYLRTEMIIEIFLTQKTIIRFNAKFKINDKIKPKQSFSCITYEKD